MSFIGGLHRAPAKIDHMSSLREQPLILKTPAVGGLILLDRYHRELRQSSPPPSSAPTIFDRRAEFRLSPLAAASSACASLRFRRRKTLPLDPYRRGGTGVQPDPIILGNNPSRSPAEESLSIVVGRTLLGS